MPPVLATKEINCTVMHDRRPSIPVDVDTEPLQGGGGGAEIVIVVITILMAFDYDRTYVPYRNSSVLVVGFQMFVGGVRSQCLLSHVRTGCFLLPLCVLWMVALSSRCSGALWMVAVNS